MRTGHRPLRPCLNSMEASWQHSPLFPDQVGQLLPDTVSSSVPRVVVCIKRLKSQPRPKQRLGKEPWRPSDSFKECTLMLEFVGSRHFR